MWRLWHKGLGRYSPLGKFMSATALLSHALFAAALTVLSAALTWLILRKIRIIDTPNARSSHSTPTPSSGGIAIAVTFFVGIAIYALLSDQTRIAEPHFLGFIVAALSIAALSIYDDLHGMGFRHKLVFQIAAGVVVMAFGVLIESFQFPFFGKVELGLLAWPITLMWIIGLTNAFNFMDGLDGLAAGTTVIATLFFAAITFTQGSTFIYLMSIIVAASTLGFLLWNFPPAKIFMGDSGSQFLGFVLAVMAVIAGAFDASHTSYFVMPLLFFHFIWDAAFTFFRRMRRGEAVTTAHRSHLYQLMNRLGASHKQVTLMHLAMTFAQGLGALLLVNLEGSLRLWVFVPFVVVQVLYTRRVMARAEKAGLLV